MLQFNLGKNESAQHACVHVNRPNLPVLKDAMTRLLDQWLPAKLKHFHCIAARNLVLKLGAH